MRVRVRVPWYAVGVLGMFRGPPWKMLSKVLAQAVPRQATAHDEKRQQCTCKPALNRDTAAAH